MQRRSPKKRAAGSLARPSVRLQLASALADEADREREIALEEADRVGTLEEIQQKLLAAVGVGFAATLLKSRLVITRIDVDDSTDLPVVVDSITISDNIAVTVAVQVGNILE